MENNTILCPTCNTENPVGSNFCLACGHSLLTKPKAKQCPKCNTVFDDSDNNCGLCGETLVYNEVADDVQKITVSAEDKDPTICRRCGAENPKAYNYCSRCGSSLASGRKRYCTNCGKESSGLYDLCSGCGSSLLVSPKAAVKKVKKAPKSSMSLTVINKAVLLLLAAMLLAFSFLPILNYEVAREKKNDKINVKCSSIDAITFAIDNLISKDMDEIQDSNFYAKFEEATEEIKELDFDDDYITRSDKKKVAKYVKLAFRVALRLDDYAASPTLMIAAICALVYVALSIACFVFALISFIKHFFGSKSYTRITMKLLFFIPFVTLISHYALAKALSTMSNTFYDVKYGMGAMLVSMIIAAILCAGIVVQNAIAKNGSFSVKRTVLCAVSLVLLTTTLMLCSANVLKLNVKTKFSNKEMKTSVSMPVSPEIYDYIDTARKGPDDETLELITGFENKQAYLNDLLDEYSLYSTTEAKKGKTDIVTRDVIYALILCYNRDTVAAFSTTSLLLTLAFAFAAISMALVVLALCSLKTRSVFEILSSVLSFVFAVGAVVLNCVLILTLRNAISYLSPETSIRAGFTFGIIAFAIFALLALISVIIQAVCLKNKKQPYETYNEIATV